MKKDDINELRHELESLKPPKPVNIEDYGYTNDEYEALVKEYEQRRSEYNRLHNFFDDFSSYGCLPVVLGVTIFLIGLCNSLSLALKTGALLITISVVIYAISKIGNNVVESINPGDSPLPSYENALLKHKQKEDEYCKRKEKLLNEIKYREHEINHPYILNLEHTTKCIVIDTETNGLIKNKRVKPRMVQLAYSVVQPNRKILLSKNYIVRPDGFDPNPSGKLKHGITKQFAQEKGIGIQEILHQLSDVMEQYDVTCLIAHNAEFDIGIILHEYKIHGLHSGRFSSLKVFDTMIEGVNLVKHNKKEYDNRVKKYIEKHNIVNTDRNRDLASYMRWLEQSGQRYKWPTLKELYESINKTPLENWHNAESDVAACRECFFYMALKENHPFCLSDYM